MPLTRRTNDIFRHLVVSAVVPARSLLGLSVGWFVGALVVLVVGTPALEVPRDDAVRALARRGFNTEAMGRVKPRSACSTLSVIEV